MNIFLFTGGVNEVNKRITDWTMDIRSKYDKYLNETQNIKEGYVTFVVNAINEKFISDNLYLNEIILNGIKLNFCGNDHNVNGKRITLLLINHKYFSLVPQNMIKMNEQLKQNIKLASLQVEVDLFQHLCYKRIGNLTNIKNLAETYNNERKIVRDIISLKDFNAILCHRLHLKPNFSSKSDILFSYLTSLENVDPKEESLRLKTIKNIYVKALYTLVKIEQDIRRQQNLMNLQESKEELYIKELIKAKEEEKMILLEDLKQQENKIENDQNLINTLLQDKETAKDRYIEKTLNLKAKAEELKEKLAIAQQKVRDLNEKQFEARKKIMDTEAEISKLKIELQEVENELNKKEQQKNNIEKEIQELNNQKKKLDVELKLIKKNKEKKEIEQRKKEEDIEICKALMKLIENLQTILSTNEFQEKKEIIKNNILAAGNLKMLLDTMQNYLTTISLWSRFIEGVNYQKLYERITTCDQKIAGELQMDIFHRIKTLICNSINPECELVQDIVNGKTINRFKMIATVIRYDEIHNKVKEYVKRAMQSNKSTNGFDFNEHLLTCQAIENISQLEPSTLKNLIEKKIEMNNKSEDVDKKKNSTFTDAANVINELKIDYKDVVKLYVDEIEIVCSGKFLLNDSPSYHGVDLTINAVNMECIGDNLTLDTSGKSGHKFRFQATHGKDKRINRDEPKGDKGHDGYDGEHGEHGGNIIIRVENEIKNLKALKFVFANGGNGGEGQLGGDGDEGAKGKYKSFSCYKLHKFYIIQWLTLGDWFVPKKQDVATLHPILSHCFPFHVVIRNNIFYNLFLSNPV